MFEIEVVWLRYRDEMMNMLEDTDSNNPFSISESTKPLPDRIFQMIQDDLLPAGVFGEQNTDTFVDSEGTLWSVEGVK